MNRFPVISLVATSVVALTAPTAFADAGGKSGSKSIEINPEGIVATVCSVSADGLSGESSLDFSTPVAGGTPDSVTLGGIEVRCNSANGVRIELITRTGRLTSGSNPGVDYIATLSLLDTSTSLSANGTPGANAGLDLSASEALSAGTEATLEIAPQSFPMFAGEYDDTITVAVISGG